VHKLSSDKELARFSFLFLQMRSQKQRTKKRNISNKSDLSWIRQKQAKSSESEVGKTCQLGTLNSNHVDEAQTSTLFALQVKLSNQLASCPIR